MKPYTEEVRREIDWELVDRGVDFMKRQKAAGKPFFLYLPISRTHFPNLPSKRFEGASRIGQFGDSLMEGDAIVGRMLDSIEGARAGERHHRGLRLRQWAPRPGRARIRRRHARHGIARTLSRRAWRRERRLDPHRRHDPLAGPDRAAIVLRDVLDHGFLPDLRAPCGRQGAGRSADRRRRPDRPAARQRTTGRREHC